MHAAHEAPHLQALGRPWLCHADTFKAHYQGRRPTVELMQLHTAAICHRGRAGQPLPGQERGQLQKKRHLLESQRLKEGEHVTATAVRVEEIVAVNDPRWNAGKGGRPADVEAGKEPLQLFPRHGSVYRHLFSNRPAMRRAATN